MSLVRPLFVSFLASGLLAGCGGGSDGGGSATAPASNTMSVFAAASGPLCAVKKGNVCAEPTSSSMTQQQFLAAQTDPQSPAFELVRYGYTMSTHAKTQGGGLVEGAYTYDTAEKSIILEAGKLKLDGRTYAFSTTQTGGTLDFRDSGNNAVLVSPSMAPSAGEVVLHFSQTDLSSSATGTLPNLTITSDSTSWHSYFGLLTDINDVSAPANNTIHYSGFVNLVAGDGSPGALLANVVSGACPINLDLEVSTGTVTSTSTPCADVARHSTLDFSLQNVRVKDSRVSGNFGTEALASITGPAGGVVNAQTVSAVFVSSKLGGAIYGRNAQNIVIQGSGPLGAFFVTGTRQ